MKARARPSECRPKLADRISLWLSTSRHVDGLWIGAMEDPPGAALRRVEDALHLIKRHSPLHYSRVIRHLQRVWVWLLPGDAACYERSLDACVMDPRFVTAETTTIEQIATTIIHEATHARLERSGIVYEETLRTRIELICLRRELSFAKTLPDAKSLLNERAQFLDWFATNNEFFSDASFRERRLQGEIEALHHLGLPDWLIRNGLAFRSLIVRLRNLFRRTQSA